MDGENGKENERDYNTLYVLFHTMLCLLQCLIMYLSAAEYKRNKQVKL